MPPLVSILIPCYNAERYVGEAIESALAQTWPNKEIIVVNDGSADQSPKVLQPFANIAGIKIIEQENRGASAARNRAFRESRGDFIKFFDADDRLHPELIERQMQRLGQRHDAVASAAWGRFYHDDLSSFKLNPEPVWRDLLAIEWMVQSWSKARPMMQPAIWLMPRLIVEAVGGWNERLSLIDDFEFFSRVLCQVSEVLFASDAPVYYRSGLAGSLSGSRGRRAAESACESLLLGTSHLLARRSDATARRACASVLKDFVYSYYPSYPDLRKKINARVEQLGGSTLGPDGPPRFHLLRKLTGWKLARRVQKLAGR